MKLVFRSKSIALAEFSKGFSSASIRVSTHCEIYGFLIVYPIRLRAYDDFYLIVGWALLRQVDKLGTIIGRDVWSCLADELAMTPKIQI